MKKQSVSSNFLFLIFFCFTIVKADPLLVAVLMIKNEAPVICATLQPLLDAGIDSYFIYDTGSTDETIEVTHNFFSQNNITNFIIVQEPFIDFSASRNKALQYTKQYFPDAIFMLMLDAEWHLVNGADLIKFCQENQNDTTVLYNISINVCDTVFKLARLMRCDAHIYFTGKIHERTNLVLALKDKDSQDINKIPAHIYFKRTSSKYGIEKTNKRLLQDLNILLEAVKNNPADASSVFYLAQTYQCLNDVDNAIKWYEQRIAMPQDQEENSMLFGIEEATFLTHSRLAEIYRIIGNITKMIYHYFKAFNLRPHRAEPLIELAIHYFNTGAYNLSYLLIKHTLRIAYPKDELSMVNKELYEFTRYDLAGRVAGTCNDYVLGLWATQQAMQVRPNEQYLHENLAWYKNKIHEETLKHLKTLPTPYNTLTELLPFKDYGWYYNGSWMEQLFKHNHIVNAVEVGSWLGASTCHIAQLLPENGKLYAIDTWAGSAENHDFPEEALMLPTLYEQFLSNIIHMQLTHKIIPIKMDSLKATEHLKIYGQHFDFIYIDAAHDTQSVLQDLQSYFPFVIHNHGILCGDDWRMPSVKTAVLQFAQEHELTVYADDIHNFWFLKEEEKYKVCSFLNSPDSVWKFFQQSH